MKLERATATAKSSQSCSTVCDPIDSSPPGFSVPGILQARTLEWVAIAFWHIFNRIKRIQWKSADRVPGPLLCNQNAGEWSQTWDHPIPQPPISYPAWDRRLLIRRLLGFPGGAAVKNLPAMQDRQETQVWTLCQEDCLEKEMATHSSILAWRIPGTEKLGGLQSKGLERIRYDWMTKHCTWKGNHYG